MIQTRKKYCIWALTATFGLLSALNLGSLHAADVKWHPGAFFRTLGAPKTETVSIGRHQLTSQGYTAPGWVLIGWSERAKPALKTQVAEDRVRPMYRVGDFLDIQGDKTLYAVWAIDANNDGLPDYRAGKDPLPLDAEWIDKMLADLEAKRRAAEGGTAHRSSLRSAPLSLPAWDIHDDILAYKDKVVYVGCPYNTDTSSTHKIDEPMIAFYKSNAFGGFSPERVIANKDMELVVEYGGVLEDTCLVGGRPKDAQKPLARIPFPKAPSTPGSDTVKAYQLFSCDPMMFTRIKGDGEAVLKMYFVKKGTDTLANSESATDTSYFKEAGTTVLPTLSFKGQGKPFINEETGEFSDTLTFRFQIYNQPEFAATSISTDILYGDTIYLKYAHLRGTPTKYMMRSFDGGWNWHPADSPLTDVERDLLQGDSVRICLRQLDRAVGWAAYQKARFTDPEQYTYEDFKTNQGVDGELQGKYREHCGYVYYKGLFDRIKEITGYVHLRDTIDSLYTQELGIGTWSDFGGDEKREMLEGFQEVLLQIDIMSSMYPFYYTQFITKTDYYSRADKIKDIEKRDLNTVFGKWMAERVGLPDWCRNEPYCFYVSKGAVPIIERTVFIPRVEGVTVLTPELGQNSVRSQKDFTFRLKYAGKPMKVIAKRMIDGRVIGEVTGTPNADGEYEYVIRRVMQDITLEFTSADANTLVDQPSVWAYGGTLRIRSPKETTVRIYSASGLLVKQVAVHGDTAVPLAAGLYMVVLSDGTTHKVIVQ